MALVKAKTRTKKRPITYDDPVAALIQRRRYQILVHSLIYYELDTDLITDAHWQELAYDLVRLQNQHPDVADKVIFSEAFKDFDGSTGFNLPLHDAQIIDIAGRLLTNEPNIGGREVHSALLKLMSLEKQPSEYSRLNK